MSNVIHFEYRRLDRYVGWAATDDRLSFVKMIGCGAVNPDRKAIELDRVTCGRCKRSRSYKAYRAYVLGLIDKKMLNEIGLVISEKLV